MSGTCTYCMPFHIRNHSLESQQVCCGSIFQRHGPAGKETIRSVWVQHENGRTMLPGLSITINSRSTSWRRILTGVEVTGGSCLWTTFLHITFMMLPSDRISYILYALYTISVSNNSVWFRDLPVNRCYTWIQCIPLTHRCYSAPFGMKEKTRT